MRRGRERRRGAEENKEGRTRTLFVHEEKEEEGGRREQEDPKGDRGERGH